MEVGRVSLSGVKQEGFLVAGTVTHIENLWSQENLKGSARSQGQRQQCRWIFIINWNHLRVLLGVSP